MDELDTLRSQINEIDAQLRILFERRMSTAGSIAQYKREHDLPVLNAAREAEVLKANVSALENKDLAPLYTDFLRENMALSRAYQAQLLGENTVAYQGTEGAYSHIALRAMYPHANALSVATFRDVFDCVESSQTKYGVLPLENSFAGDVSEVLDLCFERKVYVVAQYDLPVKHSLVGAKGAKLADITKVYSHSQAISQCGRFLAQHNIDAVSHPNTALAAKYVAELADIHTAAIASDETAALYGLDVLASDIATSTHNTTRFIVIGKRAMQEGNRFCILFTVSHTVGSLAAVCETIGEMGLNLESIKSRPMPDLAWQYYFYAEIVGDCANSKALQARLDHICKTVRILGIYKK